MKKLLLLFLSILLVSCTVAQDDEIGFIDIAYYEEQEGGWREGFIIEAEKEYQKGNKNNYKFEINDEHTLIYFDGYNLKYPRLDNCYIPVYDQNKEEVDQAYPMLISLIHDQTRVLEVNLITDYFQEKKFDQPISIDQLDDLDLEYFDKENLVYLYNKTLMQDPKKFGHYLGDICKIKQVSDENNIIWQAGSYGVYGYITDIQLEIIIDDEYLSNKDELSELESLMIEETEKIENYILESQDLTLKNMKLKFDYVNIEAIKEALQKIYDTVDESLLD